MAKSKVTVSSFAKERGVDPEKVLDTLNNKLQEFHVNTRAVINELVLEKLEPLFPKPEVKKEAKSQQTISKMVPQALKQETKKIIEEEKKEEKRLTPTSIPLPKKRVNNPFALASQNSGVKSPFKKKLDEEKAKKTAANKTGDKTNKTFGTKPLPYTGFRGKSGKGAAQRGAIQGAFGRNKKDFKKKKSNRAKRQELEEMAAPTVGPLNIPNGQGKEIKLHQGASLMDLADKIGVDSAKLVTFLFQLGEISTASQSLDQDTIELLGLELGYKIVTESPEEADKELLQSFDINLDDEQGDYETRPPIVTIMGHVDHGKTTLLDTIRNTNVWATEAGGITQKIGAYQVEIEYEGVERAITFIDTPGHEAFTAMRARGAEVTDLAVLVVAANDGVMPQTIEALNHAKAAKVPIVVAVNKIDVPGADPAKVRGQLAEYGLVDEAYGGDTLFIDISAKKNLNIDKLLDGIILTSDLTLSLKANPDKNAQGSIIESKLDRGRGSTVSVLVQNGTLKVGQPIVAGTSYGKVRLMTDEFGNKVEEAYPSEPVILLGFESVPSAGDQIVAVDEERVARQIAEKREASQRASDLARRRSRVTLEEFTSAVSESKLDTLSLIIKGDTSGSVEAIEESIYNIEVPAELKIDVIHRAVGDITQNDINLAKVDNGIIIAFNVKTQTKLQKSADQDGVQIKNYKVIYAVTEDIEKALKGMLKPIFETFETGRAEVQEIFSSSKFGEIAGSLVRSGFLKKNKKASVLRNDKEIATNLKIESLRRFKDDVTEVKEGIECGISIEGFKGFEVGDIIVGFDEREVPRD